MTDDTDAIQAAINACIAAGGGIVWLPAGIYKITAPLLITSDNVIFAGDGMGVAHNLSGSTWGPTVLVPTNAAAFSGSAVIVAKQTGVPTRSLQGIELRDFAVWGGSLVAGVHGISAMIGSSRVQRVRMENVPGDSFHFDGVATDGWNNDIEFNYAQNPGTGGLYFALDAPDQRVSHNTVLSSSGYGIKSVAPGLTIAENFILDCDGKAIDAYIYETKCYGNRIEDCNGGIYLSGANGYGGFSIVGNKLWNCSKDTDNTTDSVNVTASATTRGGTIQGNDFYTNEGLSNGGTAGAKNRARYHVNIASSNVQDVVVGHNSYLGYNNASSSYGTAAVNDDGTRTQIAPIVLARSAIASSHTGDTNESTLASITVPGGLMGKKGRLVVTALWTVTNNANNKTLRTKLGATAYSGLVQPSVATVRQQVEIANRGAQNSQVAGPNGSGFTGFTSSTSPVTTSAEDTSADKTLALTGQLADAADTVTLQSYTVELIQ